ncbi:hypothetical protein H5410_064903 [Solanum commersonii]|uniref:Uncharacterized protein n=1 Tax=Solanum commersonii TaxID=4109 RepID=A0A9J5VY37_SOLCO|nr:hypothetical protein H5410_064903 [Solanum commersonii]
MKLQIPTSVLKLAMKFARLVDIFQGDNFTDSTKFLKDMITIGLLNVSIYDQDNRVDAYMHFKVIVACSRMVLSTNT